MHTFTSYCFEINSLHIPSHKNIMSNPNYPNSIKTSSKEEYCLTEHDICIVGSLLSFIDLYLHKQEPLLRFKNRNCVHCL